MSENVVYKVKANGSEYGADDKASAEALAELLGGEVFTTSRKEALARIRKVTAKPNYPSELGHMLADIKDTIVREVTANKLMAESVWRVTVQYDSERETWYSEVKNLAAGPEVYNQTTGEKYTSVAHARWEHGKSCAVKYLANGISDDKFSKAKPEVILKEQAKAKAAAAAVAEAAEDTILVLMESGMSEEEARASLPA